MLRETTLSPPDATFVVEVVAFLVVLAVITKFVMPRIRATIEARQARIASALASAEAADRHRTAVEEECHGLLAAARHEARIITDGARATKEHLIAEGRREGQAEYTWRLSRIEREHRRRDDQLRRRLTLEVRQAVLNAIRESSKDEPEAARLTAIVHSASILPESGEMAGRLMPDAGLMAGEGRCDREPESPSDSGALDPATAIS